MRLAWPVQMRLKPREKLSGVYYGGVLHSGYLDTGSGYVWLYYPLYKPVNFLILPWARTERVALKSIEMETFCKKSNDLIGSGSRNYVKGGSITS
jgi:hypothetical protein